MPVNAVSPSVPPSTSQMPTRCRAIACFVGYWVVLVLLTHWPNPFPGGSEPQHYDKLGHFGLYCVLAALAGEVVLSGRRIGGYPIGGLAARLAVVFVAVAAFGLADELTQPLTGRDCDRFDWLADCFGATCGVLLAGWRRRG